MKLMNHLLMVFSLTMPAPKSAFSNFVGKNPPSTINFLHATNISMLHVFCGLGHRGKPYGECWFPHL